jgi:hypothetical protein
MGVDVTEILPKTLQLCLSSAPGEPEAPVLQQIFADLAHLDYETFAVLPDGGASMGNSLNARSLVIQAAQRAVTTPIDGTTRQALDEALEILRIVDLRQPAPMYLLWQAAITSHLPVEGSSAASLLDREVFGGNTAAFESLGKDRLGTGIRVLLDAGRASLAVEPLITSSDTLFIQYAARGLGEFRLGDIRTAIDGVLRFHDHQVREFLTRLLHE